MSKQKSPRSLVLNEDFEIKEEINESLEEGEINGILTDVKKGAVVTLNNLQDCFNVFDQISNESFNAFQYGLGTVKKLCAEFENKLGLTVDKKGQSFSENISNVKLDSAELNIVAQNYRDLLVKELAHNFSILFEHVEEQYKSDNIHDLVRQIDQLAFGEDQGYLPEIYFIEHMKSSQLLVKKAFLVAVSLIDSYILNLKAFLQNPFKKVSISDLSYDLSHLWDSTIMALKDLMLTLIGDDVDKKEALNNIETYLDVLKIKDQIDSSKGQVALNKGYFYRNLRQYIGSIYNTENMSEFIEGYISEVLNNQYKTGKDNFSDKELQDIFLHFHNYSAQSEKQGSTIARLNLCIELMDLELKHMNNILKYLNLNKLYLN